MRKIKAFFTSPHFKKNVGLVYRFRKKSIKKLHLSLIEILLVLAILTFALGGIGLNIHKMLLKQHFQSEVEAVVDALRLAQNLMLIMDADVHVHIKARKDNTANEIWIEMDNEIPFQSPLQLVINKKKPLEYIHYIHFKDANKTHSDDDRIDIKFISKGSFMSKNVMRLSTHKKESNDPNALEAFICLAGFPKAIYSTLKENEDPACDEKQEKELDTRLTQLILQEIDIHADKNKTDSTP